MGWTGSSDEFNFSRDYGDYWGKDSKNPGNMQIRRNMTLSCLKTDSGQISPASMMKINRSHLEGTVAEPRWGAPETFWATPCMHDSVGSGYHSAASIVAHLRAEMPPLLRQVYWAGFSNPCCNVFKPFYMHGPKVPEGYAVGTSTYSDDSPWWWANRINLLSDLNYRPLSPTVRAIFERTEDWEMLRQRRYEAEAQRLIAAGDAPAAVEILQKFVDENCERIEREYRMLNQTLPAMLETVGKDYLFTEYLKEWTSRKGVPLPLDHN